MSARNITMLPEEWLESILFILVHSARADPEFVRMLQRIFNPAKFELLLGNRSLAEDKTIVEELRTLKKKFEGASKPIEYMRLLQEAPLTFSREVCDLLIDGVKLV